MTQLSIFDMQLSDPPCYTCKHALKRGNFRVCSKQGVGYKHIGEKIVCNLFERSEDDKVKVRGFDRRQSKSTQTD